jgi:hypothetical protein
MSVLGRGVVGGSVIPDDRQRSPPPVSGWSGEFDEFSDAAVLVSPAWPVPE